MAEYRITNSSLLSSHPFTDEPSLCVPSSDQGSKTSLGTSSILPQTPIRASSVSANSPKSLSSNTLRARDENASPLGAPSASSPSLPLKPLQTSLLKSASESSICKLSWESHASSRKDPQRSLSYLRDTGTLEDIDLNSLQTVEDEGNIQERGVSFDIVTKETSSTPRNISDTSHEAEAAKRFDSKIKHPFGNGRPFRKWIGTKRDDQPTRAKSLIVREARWNLDDFHDDKPGETDCPRRRRNGRRHKKSSSWSAHSFVSAVKTATAGFVPTGPTTGSGIISRSGTRRSDRSSMPSEAAPRTFKDGNQDREEILQKDELERAMQCRRVLDELIGSEEGYVADLKVLLHVYVYVLESAPKIAQAAQPGISQNLADMLHLHEDLLTDVRSARENPSDAARMRSSTNKRSQTIRGHSTDNSESNVSSKAAQVIRRSFDFHWLGKSKDHVPGSCLQEAVDVTRVFERMLPRFFIYEEYGARYETMLRDMVSLSRIMPNWSTYERGIESLVNSLIPPSSSIHKSRKGLTFDDLLIKPIQRVCRYPLLFTELYKHISATDDPTAKAEIEKLCSRLRETADEINKATNDLQTQRRIQRSWHLQDLLDFPDTCPTTFSLRLLGHAFLCGVLYIAYQSRTDIIGSYMLCALFKSYLLLAVPRSGRVTFEIMAIISLSDAQIDQSDGGRGLQCYTAPFSWKFLFESQQQTYEILLCACSAREEEQWKSSIRAHAYEEARRESGEPAVLSLLSFENSMLCFDIQSIGPVFGQRGSLLRRQSIQRAATINSRKNSCQVIIKNTFSLKDSGESPLKRYDSISRSQTLMSTCRIPTLTPRRVDRQRMEQKMSAVWTEDRLPYPGMTGYRGGQLIRTSANSLMRKLSMASIASVGSTIYSTQASTTGSFVKQRTVTYGSIGQSSPYTNHSSSLRENQTDGASSPYQENTQVLLEFDPSISEQQDPISEVETPLQEARHDAVLVPRRRTDPESRKDSGTREASEASTVVVNKHIQMAEHEKIPGKKKKKALPRRSKRLLKALSTEGIRGWFH